MNVTLSLTIATKDGLYHLEIDEDGELTMTEVRGMKSVTISPRELVLQRAALPHSVGEKH